MLPSPTPTASAATAFHVRLQQIQALVETDIEVGLRYTPSSVKQLAEYRKQQIRKGNDEVDPNTTKISQLSVVPNVNTNLPALNNEFQDASDTSKSQTISTGTSPLTLMQKVDVGVETSENHIHTSKKCWIPLDQHIFASSSQSPHIHRVSRSEFSNELDSIQAETAVLPNNISGSNRATYTEDLCNYVLDRLVEDTVLALQQIESTRISAAEQRRLNLFYGDLQKTIKEYERNERRIENKWFKKSKEKERFSKSLSLQSSEISLSESKDSAPDEANRYRKLKWQTNLSPAESSAIVSPDLNASINVYRRMSKRRVPDIPAEELSQASERVIQEVVVETVEELWQSLDLYVEECVQSI